jgi:hypothetical protein
MYKFILKNNPEYQLYKQEVFRIFELGASREDVSNLLEIHIKSVEKFFDMWAFKEAEKW